MPHRLPPCRERMHSWRVLLALAKLCACCVPPWHGVKHRRRWDQSCLQWQYSWLLLKTCCVLQVTATPATNVTQPSATGQQVQTWAEKLREGYAELKTEGAVSLPTIVYSSRTHSQLAQVIKELRNTSYRLAIISAHCIESSSC